MMSGKIKLFNQVLQLTRGQQLRWIFAPRANLESIVYQAKTVFRAFQTEMNVQGDDFTVLLVEKKYPDAEWDFEIEKYSPEMLFVSNGQLVLSIDDNDVDRLRFGELVQIIESSTPSARKLLNL